MGEMYNKDYCTEQGSHLKSMEKQKTHRQAKIKRIQHHQTSFIQMLKGLIKSRNTRVEKELQNKLQKIKKMAIGTYISIITFNVNGLNVPTKRHGLA